MTAPPIVVLGITQRSGTNFLADVLLCHPDCVAPPPPLHEDFLLAEAHRLVDYAESLGRRWPPRWGPSDDIRDEILRHLGDGLVAFLASRDGGRRVVTKTPSVDNLDLYPRLLSGAPLVLLVRDGRSVVESLVTGFGYSYDAAIRRWRRGAEAIVRFRDEAQRDVAFTIVRYEDLVADFDSTVRALLTFLTLDPAQFEWDRARNLPVRGSSFDRPSHGALTWEPVGRPETSEPMARFAGWDAATSARFEWLAGRWQRALGYDLPSSGRRRVRNAALDAVWPVRAAATRARTGAVRAALRVRDRRRGRLSAGG